MRRRVLLIMAFLQFLEVSLATQGTSSLDPVYLTARSNVSVRSPDGKWQLVILESKPGVFPWLALERAKEPNDREQKWPLQRNACYVLWRSDSKAFAVTDPEYANHYFIRVFSTDFQLEGSVLGSPAIDLNVPLEKSFRELASRFYAPKQFDIDLFFVKALRWLGTDQLLVGLDARTDETPGRTARKGSLGPRPAVRVRDWYRGYIMSPEKREVVRQLDDAAMRREFGIDLEKETW